MSSCIDFINGNRDKVDIKISHVIDDKTLTVYFFMRTNVFCDGVNYYLGKDSVSVPIKNKKELRSFLSQVNGKMVLHATDNSMGFTRLIYKIKLK